MAVRVTAGRLPPPHGVLRRHFLGRVVAAALLLFAQSALAETGGLESRVKAAFLYNFTKFVDWPAGTFATADSPITVCILGADPFGEILDSTISGKVVNNRQLQPRRIGQLEDIRGCRILYVSSSERSRLREVLASAKSLSILTVGEAPEFIDTGGMIRFLIVDDKVRFDINATAAEQARLNLSSKLLGVAHTVVGGPGG